MAPPGRPRPVRRRRPRRPPRSRPHLAGRAGAVRRGHRSAGRDRGRRARPRPARRRRRRRDPLPAGTRRARRLAAAARPGPHPPGLRRAPAPRPPPGRRPRAPAYRAGAVRGPRRHPVGRAGRAGTARLRGDRPPPRRHDRHRADPAGTPGRRPGPAGPVEPGRGRAAVRQSTHRRLSLEKLLLQVGRQLPRRAHRSLTRPVTGMALHVKTASVAVAHRSFSPCPQGHPEAACTTFPLRSERQQLAVHSGTRNGPVSRHQRVSSGVSR